ncbi:MAG: hypothetical protein R2844_05135 [Caldilineales bacterium]
MPDTDPLRFQTSRTFQFLYLLPILLAGALLVDLVVGGGASSWPLIIGALLLALFTVPRALARVDLEDGVLSLRMPLRKPQQVALRQLVSYERSGRIGRALILRYHPVDDAGRVNTADEMFLGLPPLEQQMDLEERLEAVVNP